MDNERYASVNCKLDKHATSRDPEKVPFQAFHLPLLFNTITVEGKIISYALTMGCGSTQ